MFVYKGKAVFSVFYALALSFPVAKVGLEKTLYIVSGEASTAVAVCATVNSPRVLCPIEFPFNISLNRISNNTGIDFWWQSDTASQKSNDLTLYRACS